MKKTIIAAAVATAMVMGGTAIAAPKAMASGSSFTKGNGWFVGVGAGYSNVQSGVTKVAASDIGGAFSANQVQGGLAGSIFGGYMINKYLGFEMSYDRFANTTQASSDTMITSDGPVTTLEGVSTSMQGIGFGLVGYTPAFHGLSGFVKVGGEYLHSDNTLGGVSGDATVGGYSAFTTDSVAFTYGLGVNYAFTEHLSAQAEWKQILQQSGVKTSFENSEGQALSGTIPQMNLFTANLVYKF
tara:strand:+ start:23282 stop:24007 length:726 start_codon:yes stop_codon:yes gene_type:complete